MAAESGNGPVSGISCDRSNNDTPISTIWKNNRIEHITSKHITYTLLDAVTAIREDILHIATHVINTDSVRSGAAMVMFH